MQAAMCAEWSLVVDESALIEDLLRGKGAIGCKLLLNVIGNSLKELRGSE